MGSKKARVDIMFMGTTETIEEKRVRIEGLGYQTVKYFYNSLYFLLNL